CSLTLAGEKRARVTSGGFEKNRLSQKSFPFSQTKWFIETGVGLTGHTDLNGYEIFPSHSIGCLSITAFEPASSANPAASNVETDRAAVVHSDPRVARKSRGSCEQGQGRPSSGGGRSLGQCCGRTAPYQPVARRCVHSIGGSQHCA